jgi:hypothetical protein
MSLNKPATAESYEGAWLQASLAEDIALVPEARSSICAEALKAFVEKPFETMELAS